MPAKFHPVAPAVWDRSMRSLGRDEQVVRLYVMTCRDRVSEGLFQLPLGIIAHDTGMDEGDVEAALKGLGDAGLVVYDPDAEVVLDRTALKHAPLKHGRDPETGEVRRNRAMPAAVKMFSAVPATPLKEELYQLAKRYADDFAGALLDHDPTLGSDPSPIEGGSKGDANESASQGTSMPGSGGGSRGDARGSEGGSRGEASRGEVSSGVGARECEACGGVGDGCWCGGGE